MSILLQTKDVGGQFRVPGTGKYPPTSGKFNRSWSKSQRAYGGLGYSFSQSDVGQYFGPEARNWVFQKFCCVHGLAYSFSLKVKWGSISAQKLESERSKTFAVSISLQTKTSRSKLTVPGTGKYPPSSGKSTRSLSKSRCV